MKKIYVKKRRRGGIRETGQIKWTRLLESSGVPNAESAVERSSKNLVAIVIVMHGDYFASVAFQRGQFLATKNVKNFGSCVERSSSNFWLGGREPSNDDLCLMTPHSYETVAGSRAPNARCFIKRARHDFVPTPKTTRRITKNQIHFMMGKD